MNRIKSRRQDLVLAIMKTRLRQFLSPDEIIGLDPMVASLDRDRQLQREQVRIAIYALQHEGYSIQIDKRSGRSVYRLLSDSTGEIPTPAKKFVVGYEFRSQALAQDMAQALNTISGRKAKIYEI